jgi:hypothetical protein
MIDDDNGWLWYDVLRCGALHSALLHDNAVQTACGSALAVGVLLSWVLRMG